MLFSKATRTSPIDLVASIVGNPMAFVGQFVLHSISGQVTGHQIGPSDWAFSVTPTAPDAPLLISPFNLWAINPHWTGAAPDIQLVATQGGVPIPNIDPPLLGKGANILVTLTTSGVNDSEPFSIGF